MPTIVLDPGHGSAKNIGNSNANNAVGQQGILEKHVNLELAKATSIRLRRAGYEVQLTRETDNNLGLTDRAAVAQKSKAEVFISIHFNAYDQVAQGTETFLYLEHSENSLRLASAIQRRVVATTGYRDRGVQLSRYGVLNPRHHSRETAAALLEVSFLDVEPEEIRLREQSYLAGLADSLVIAADDYFATDPVQTYKPAKTRAISILSWLIKDKDA